MLTPPPDGRMATMTETVPKTNAVVKVVEPERQARYTEIDGNMNAPQQRRSVSMPTQAEKLDPGPEAEAGPSQTIPDSINGKTASGYSLTFPYVASMFVKLRRVQKKVKAHHIDSTSGSEPLTHDTFVAAEDAITPKKLARLEIQDVYVCTDAVDVLKLLRASRASLLDRSNPLHANILIDEHWSSSICGPKHRNDGSFRVHIRYTATAAYGSHRDPLQPVALDKATSVPGLMTITTRETISLNVLEFYQMD